VSEVTVDKTTTGTSTTTGKDLSVRELVEKYVAEEDPALIF